MDQKIFYYQKHTIPEIKVSYRNDIPKDKRYTLKASKDSYDFLLALWDKDTIEFTMELKALYLNRTNEVIGIKTITTGNVWQTEAPPNIILAIALACNATNIVIAYNHPSGNLKPSRESEKNIHELITAAKLHKIGILDTIIVTNDSYFSFADEGLLF